MNETGTTIVTWLAGLDAVEFLHRVDSDVRADPVHWPHFIVADFGRMQLLAEQQHGELPCAVLNACLRMADAWWCVRRLYFPPQGPTIDLPELGSRSAAPSDVAAAERTASGGACRSPGAAARALTASPADLAVVRLALQEASTRLGRMAEAL